MKYAVLCKHSADVIEYTVSVLNHLIKINNHELVTPDDADIIVVSVCDITQVEWVDKLKKQYPDKTLMVGGHATIYYKLFGLFADIITLGEGFEVFKCQTIDEIKALPSVWYPNCNKDVLIPSTYIDWSKVPVANVTNKQRYYWGAVGCKNKCKFCLTSWTHPHQKNSKKRIEQVLTKYPNCTIVSNDSDELPARMTQSIMLKDFLKVDLKKYAVYRIGVEFATEETRRKYGKPFTDDMFVQAIERAYQYGVRLKLFCIGGINTIDEWDTLFSKIPTHYERGNIEVKFTNINYEMFTPMVHERNNLDLNNLWNTKKAKTFISKHKERVWALKALPCTSEINCMLKNILIYTTNMSEYKQYKLLKKASAYEIYSYYKNSGILDNVYTETVKIDLKPIRRFGEK